MTSRSHDNGERRVSFSKAAGRHWQDAELLREHERLLNSDQLYGLAAECAMKAALHGLGALRLEQGLPTPAHFKSHADVLWDQFMAVAEGLYGARYSSYLPRDNPFADWTIHDRYGDDHEIPRSRIETHRSAAQRACVMLEAVRLDGLLGEGI